ncbi:hypothetical protein GRW41_23920 [Escherichia coli]|nr:hypothetical protein [Escherichia coli]
MLPSETMIWQPEFTDKTLSRKTGAVHLLLRFVSCEDSDLRLAGSDSYLAEVFPRYQCRHYDG